jgi:RNA recognition motif-containing protein
MQNVPTLIALYLTHNMTCFL